MARPNIENIRTVGDFSSVYRWDLSVVAPGVVPGQGERLNILCESSDVPKMTNQKIEVNIRGHKILRPGIAQYTNTLTLTFVETVTNDIHAVLKAWRDRIWAFRTGVQAAEAAALEAEAFTLRRLNNLDVPIWNYDVRGVWLEDYDLGQLDGSTSDFVKPQMIISYDYFDDGAL